MDHELLVQSAKKGDDKAFYQLIESNKIKLYKIAYSYLKNETDSLEAIQEVTYRAYVKIKTLKKPEYFQTWLIRIMLNYCNDELKKKSRFTGELIDLENSQSLSTGNQSMDLERLSIEAAMEKIDPVYQKVISLKYFHDLTISEIAKTLEKPEGTVKTWLNKALKGLRAQLEKEGASHV